MLGGKQDGGSSNTPPAPAEADQPVQNITGGAEPDDLPF